MKCEPKGRESTRSDKGAERIIRPSDSSELIQFGAVITVARLLQRLIASRTVAAAHTHSHSHTDMQIGMRMHPSPALYTASFPPSKLQGRKEESRPDERANQQATAIDDVKVAKLLPLATTSNRFGRQDASTNESRHRSLVRVPCLIGAQSLSSRYSFAF